MVGRHYHQKALVYIYRARELDHKLYKHALALIAIASYMALALILLQLCMPFPPLSLSMCSRPHDLKLQAGPNMHTPQKNSKKQ